MGIRIFEVDPDAAPRKRFADDIVGRFRSGAQVNNRPLSLDEWRVTTGDPEVAEAIGDLLGVKTGPQEWTTEGEDNIEVYTTSNAMEVVLDGPSAIQTAMALWGRNGLVHKCDGETITAGPQQGQPCPMAGKSVADRKEAAKAGYGCAPSIQVYFRLAADPELGKFRFTSGSWTFAGEVLAQESALAKIDGPARATLTLEVVEYDTQAGRHVRYTKPVVKILGPVES